MYQDIINILLTSDYQSIKKDINKLISDQEFIKTIIKVHNPIVFDRFIKMCEYKIDTSSLYDARKRFIKKIILELNKDNIYDFFELNDLDKARQEIIANRYLVEYIVCYYFGDNYYNFMTNFYQMVNYLDCTKKSLVSKININLYKEFVDLRNMSFEDKIGLFKMLLNEDVMSKFYDDMNKVREDSHKELVDKALKLNHNNDIYNKDISRRLGVDVYSLDGERFYGFIRCLSISKDDLIDYEDNIFSIRNRLGYSFSYIGDRNIGTIDYSMKGVTLFYDSIDYRNIMYVHHGDLHAKDMIVQDDYLSEKENEILSPSRLISKTNSYNEIYIKRKNMVIKPTALVCYNVITNKDISFAKRYGLSILVINCEKYKRYKTYEDNYDDYTYSI